ncbi:MAG: hypothetical protein F6J87_15520 [Spirulina sp. SIO3F2]|nr:hypothetical protein [Spirulina sp. SIO3F2]
MKRRDLIAGTSIALGAIALQGLHKPAQASSPLASQTPQPHLPGWLRPVNLTPNQTSAIQRIDQKFAATLNTHKQAVKREAGEVRNLKQLRAAAKTLQTQQKRQDHALQSYQATLSAKYRAYGEVLTTQQRQQVRQVLAQRHNPNSYIAAIMV